MASARTARCAHPSSQQNTPRTTLIPAVSSTRTSGRCTRSPRCVFGVLIGGEEREREGATRARRDEREGNEHRVRPAPPLSFRSTPTASFSLSHVSLSASPACASAHFVPSHLLGRALTFFQTPPKHNSKKTKQASFWTVRSRRIRRGKKNKEKKIGPLPFFFRTSKLSKLVRSLCLLLSQAAALLAQRLARLIFYYYYTIFSKNSSFLSLSPLPSLTLRSHFFLFSQLFQNLFQLKPPNPNPNKT